MLLEGLQKTRRSKPESCGVHKILPHNPFRNAHVHLRICQRSHAPCGLESHPLSSTVFNFSQHQLGSFGCGVHLHLTGRGLQHVGPSPQGCTRCGPNQFGRLQLSRLQNDLHGNLLATRGLHGTHKGLRSCLTFCCVCLEKIVVNHEVNLVCSRLKCPLCLCNNVLLLVLTEGKVHHSGHGDVGRVPLCKLDKPWPDANSGCGGL
mmetsp:Transcript_44013/g.86885  ORF Transcript_44013/g.86885 Transcript_44013/m.86885 type:complete len:205 (+) Transcript_44013:463-1077(+)